MTSLTIVEILEWYDGPEVFVATDGSGSLYLADCISQPGAGSRYRVVPVNRDQVRRLYDGGIDLRDAVLEAGAGGWWLWDLDDGEAELIRQGSPIAESELLPASGFTVAGPWNSHDFLEPGARTLGFDAPLSAALAGQSAAASG